MTWPFNQGFEFRKAAPYSPAATAGVCLVGEQKLDGWRALIVCDPKGNEAVYSRGISRVTGERIDLLTEHGELPQVTRILETLPPGSALECELIWPGKEATDVPTALRDNRKALKPVLYAAPFWCNEPLSCWEQEHNLLIEFLKDDCRLNEWGQYLAFVQFAPYPGQTVGVESMEHYAKINSFEGFILKDRNGDRWWKWKGEVTHDLVVLGATDAREGVTGKYLGQIGALVVGRVVKSVDYATHSLEIGEATLLVREIAQVSGMTDDQRLEMTALNESGDLVGRVVEVRSQASGVKTRLRHPRFLRWRDDKPAEECV